MTDQMAYEFCCLEIVLGYLPLASPGLGQKMEKSRKIEIVDPPHHHDFKKFFDFTIYMSFDSALSAGSEYIIFFRKKGL